MMPMHHPGDDLLIAYAAGSLEEPVALVVATHLALCPRCRDEVARLEELGGLLLQEQPAEALGEGDLERVLARLDEPAPEMAQEPAAPLVERAHERAGERADEVDTLVPQPLRGYLGGGLQALQWTSFRGLEKAELLTEYNGFRTRLMRIKAGTAMPTHSHEGNELTLVLAGGFSDEHGHFVRGDVAEADASIDHQPVADAGEDCICLAVTDAPLRLTGPFGRLLNPFLRV